MSDLIGTARAAAIAKKHQRTIVAWIHKGLLPAMKMPGERGPYVINQSDLEDLVNKLNTPQPYDPEKK